VDLHVPLMGFEPVPASPAEDDLKGIASYLAQARAASRELVIPADVAEFIQTEFIRLRREGLATAPNGEKLAVGEEDLRNWMRMGRLLALSYPGATFDRDVWRRVLEIDLERKIRMAAR
jgi:predicted transcriptional regulator